MLMAWDVTAMACHVMVIVMSGVFYGYLSAQLLSQQTRMWMVPNDSQIPST